MSRHKLDGEDKCCITKKLVFSLFNLVRSFSPQKWDIKLMMQLRKEGHNFQFMATEDAISSYNFMTAENRVVAAALIPPVSVSEGAKCTASFTG